MEIIDKIKEIDKLCRGCLREDDNMLDMSAKAIYEKFLLFANLIAEEEIPDIPLNLCRSCEQKLNNALDFKEKCQNSHEILLNYLREVKVEVTNEAQIPLNYVENTCEVKVEVTDDDTHQVGSEAQNTCEVDSEAADVKKPLQLEKFSQYKVWEAIEDLKQSFSKNTNCICCSYVGKNSRVLSVHISRVHKNLKPRWCCPCNAEFDDLTDHIATNHNNEYTCKFCGSKFDNIGLLTKHLHDHSDVKLFICSLCERCFIKQSQLNMHLRMHTKKKLLKCGSCDKSFTRLHWLKTHSKTHKSEGDSVKQLAAVELKKYIRAPSGDILTGHKRAHTGEKPQVCQVCEKRFAHRSVLEKHMMVHNIGKKISCNICYKKFNKTFQLHVHLRRHTGEKPFVCTECGMAFIQSSHLAEHNRTHNNVRPYQCNGCDKAFTQIGSLKRHMMIHSANN